MDFNNLPIGPNAAGCTWGKKVVLMPLGSCFHLPVIPLCSQAWSLTIWASSMLDRETLLKLLEAWEGTVTGLPSELEVELEIIGFSPSYDDPLEAVSTKKRKAQQWIPSTLKISKHPIDLTNFTFNTFKEAVFEIASKIDTKQPNSNAAILRQADITRGLTVEAYVSGHNTLGQTCKTQNHITSQETLMTFLKAIHLAPLKPHRLTFRTQDPNKKKRMEKAKGLGTSTFELANVRSMDPEAKFLIKLIKKHGTTTTNSREHWHPPMYIEGWGWETLGTVRPLTDSAPPTTNHATPCTHGVPCQNPPMPDDGLHPHVDTKKLGALRAATSLKEFLVFSGIPVEKVGTGALELENIHMRSFDMFLYTKHTNSSMLQTAGIPVGVAVAAMVHASPFYLYLVAREETRQITRGTAESSVDDGDVYQTKIDGQYCGSLTQKKQDFSGQAFRFNA
ncbi:hypothetical protein CROQUDRAFT_89278 [Cronartium quercuum f. sp. fusiforme G11]|uniref:Uncharacterized protein n=1 Tax=Cronartium quercuum f. sp. fusiforme G11 TaxID=708437 RepID=A0A9P6NS27_9BASI|nr:hypothetical protein CROQUDRAFT_89278 [Cronartium quercuum f. sp. fusiforme G11]